MCMRTLTINLMLPSSTLLLYVSFLRSLNDRYDQCTCDNDDHRRGVDNDVACNAALLNNIYFYKAQFPKKMLKAL